MLARTWYRRGEGQRRGAVPAYLLKVPPCELHWSSELRTAAATTASLRAEVPDEVHEAA